MANVSTTIVVSFSNGGGGSLSAELDSREDGLNAGKTSFSPGDTANFLVFKSTGVVLDSMAASFGTVVPIGSGLYEVEEWLSFAETSEASLSKPYYSDFEYQWFGANLGTLTPKDGTASKGSATGVGVAKVSYKARYEAYAIQSPASMNGTSEFQILVLIKGHS